MTDSRLFMSSCSRRELARRRSGRSVRFGRLAAVALVVAICAAAFLVGSGAI
jgi:hypothetical protein